MVSSRTISLFAGSWSLLNITLSQNGAVVPLDGWTPTGLISYTPEGFMQVMIQTLGQLNNGGSDVSSNDTSDLEAVLGNLTQLATIDYGGRYRFEGASDAEADSDANADGTVAGTVVHGPIEVTSVPGWLGSVFPRNFTFTGDGQYMSLAGPVDSLTAVLWWQKTPNTQDWNWESQQA